MTSQSTESHTGGIPTDEAMNNWIQNNLEEFHKQVPFFGVGPEAAVKAYAEKEKAREVQEKAKEAQEKGKEAQVKPQPAVGEKVKTSERRPVKLRRALAPKFLQAQDGKEKEPPRVMVTPPLPTIQETPTPTPPSSTSSGETEEPMCESDEAQNKSVTTGVVPGVTITVWRFC